MQLIMFAKHLKELDIPGLVAEAKRAGLDGYDVPVREGYAVNPDNVSTALGELVKAMAAEGMSVPMCTGEGSLTDPDAPEAERVIAAMAENGVRFLKTGYYKFDADTQDYWQEVDHLRKLFEKWQNLAQKHNITICYHTHSGPYMGLNASSLMHFIRGFDPQYIGAYLDAGHLSICGEDFPQACAIVGDYLKIVGLKDLQKIWIEVNGQKAIKRQVFPLGGGVTNMPEVFGHLVKIGFDGPLTIHIEFKKLTDKELIEAGRDEVPKYRELINAAQEG